MVRARKPQSGEGLTLLARRGAETVDPAPGPIDPRTFGLAKAAYSVREVLDLLSIGRTSLYAAISRGELNAVKFGKRTLFTAADLAKFLATLCPATRRSTSPEAEGHAQKKIEKRGARPDE
jgi:excisionase family DNA binding protein